MGHDGRATCRVRLDDQLATHQLQAFLHAGEAEPHASIRFLDVEAHAVIANGEIDGVSGPAKMHVEMPDLAVSHRVVQGLLEDPEEAERHVRRNVARNVLGAEIDGGALLPRELFTEAPHGRRDAEMQQPWRVQLVRQRLHFSDDVGGLAPQRVQAA